MAALNERLAKEQNISDKQRKKLAKLYNRMSELLYKASKEKYIELEGKSYSDKMKKLEFKLQKNWNFPQDELKHTWWNRFKGCTCPIIDNIERFGYEKIINCDCPLHRHLCKGL